MANGNGNGAAVAVTMKELAGRLSMINGKKITAITPEMRRKMGDMLVVVTNNGTTLVLSGGHHLGLKNGVKMDSAEFNQRLPTGVPCLFNPKFQADGSLDVVARRR